MLLYTEFIGIKSEPGELKHLSNQRKRNQLRLVVASENGIGQQLSLDNLNSLEKLTTEGDSPVKVMLILSS